MQRSLACLSMLKGTLAGRPGSIHLYQPSRTFFRIPDFRLLVIRNRPAVPDPSLPDGFSQSEHITPELEDFAHKCNRVANNLRAQGRLSPLHFQFPEDPPHIELESVRRGPSLADQYSKLHPLHWIERNKAKQAASRGDEFARDAFRPLQSYVRDPSGSLAKMAREYTRAALHGLSYSPQHHAAWESSRAMTHLYAPALKQLVSECTALLKERGDLAFHVQVDGTTDDPLTCDRDHYVLLGDRAKLQAGALLDPRTAIHQQGRTMTLCDLSHDMDSVPMDQLKVARTGGTGMQYIIDVNVIAYGTVTVSHVGTSPPIAPAPAAPTLARTGKSVKQTKGMMVKKPLGTPPRPSAPAPIDESAIVLKYPFVKPVLLRLVSNVVAPDEYMRYERARGLAWQVADVDNVVAAHVWERGRKLAAVMP